MNIDSLCQIPTIQPEAWKHHPTGEILTPPVPHQHNVLAMNVADASVACVVCDCSQGSYTHHVPALTKLHIKIIENAPLLVVLLSALIDEKVPRHVMRSSIALGAHLLTELNELAEAALEDPSVLVASVEMQRRKGVLK